MCPHVKNENGGIPGFLKQDGLRQYKAVLHYLVGAVSRFAVSPSRGLTILCLASGGPSLVGGFTTWFDGGEWDMLKKKPLLRPWEKQKTDLGCPIGGARATKSRSCGKSGQIGMFGLVQCRMLPGYPFWLGPSGNAVGKWHGPLCLAWGLVPEKTACIKQGSLCFPFQLVQPSTFWAWAKFPGGVTFDQSLRSSDARS